MGLTGIMIIDDGSDVRLDLPQTYGVDDLPIILQDRSIDSDGSIGYDNNDLDALDIAYGARGDTAASILRVPSSTFTTSHGSRCDSRADGRSELRLLCNLHFEFFSEFLQVFSDVHKLKSARII
jgi:FtsP/CotA-like multicopper oxidase with cupredoxin domain